MTGVRRAYVLTGQRRCSASEQLISGLRGAGVEVITVGGTTCGKPVGSSPTSYCETVYSVISLTGLLNAVNAGTLVLNSAAGSITTTAETGLNADQLQASAVAGGVLLKLDQETSLQALAAKAGSTVSLTKTEGDLVLDATLTGLLNAVNAGTLVLNSAAGSITTTAETGLNAEQLQASAASGGVAIKLDQETALQALAAKAGSTVSLTKTEGDLVLDASLTGLLNAVNAGTLVLNSTKGSITTTAPSGLEVGHAELFADRGVGSRDQPIWIDADSISVTTRIGDVHLRSTEDLSIGRIQTTSGNVSLSSDLGAIRAAVEQDGPAQISAPGTLSLQAEAGVGGFGLARLLVDVKEVSISNGRSGDVVVSGVSGLSIGSECVRSLARDGQWLVLMGGSGRIDAAGGTVSHAGGFSRIALFGGRSVVAESDLVAQATLARITERFIQTISAQSADASGSLKAMNDRLAKQWAERSVQNLLDRLAAEPQVLSTEIDSSLRLSARQIQQTQGRFSAFMGPASDPFAPGDSESLLRTATDVGVALDPVVTGIGTSLGSEVAVPSLDSAPRAESQEETRPQEQRLGARGFEALNRLLELAARGGQSEPIESAEGQDEEEGGA